MSPKSKRRIAITGLTLVGVLLLSLVVALPALAASCFTDTEFHWAETYICWLFNNGIASGYPDGSFRPENYITRAEMAVMLQQVAGAGSAGPVANADLLDGYDSTDYAFDGHDHMVAQADVYSQIISSSASWTEVLAIPLNIPDKCSGTDKWNVLVEATGYLYLGSGSSLSRLGLSVGSSGVLFATIRGTQLAGGDSISFATHWLFTNVDSGPLVFYLKARKEVSDADYAMYASVMTAQTLGYTCA